ncbi:hypothetical protein WJX82_003531 [Trebouxia sp. C0006]
MAYALAGSPFKTALQQKSGRRSNRPARHTIRSHLSPARAVALAKETAAKLATSLSAAAFILALPADAAAPSLFDNNSTYQQELQELISKRGSIPPLPTPPEPRKPAEGPDFKLPDVPKLTFDTPKEIADKALPEALKNLPPPPTPSPDAGTPGQPKADAPKLEAPKLEAPKIEAPKLPKIEAQKIEAPKIEAPKLPKIEAPKAEAPKLPKVEAPKLDVPKPPKVEAPKLEAPKAPSIPTPQTPALPQQEGGGLPTPYLAAGGAAVVIISALALAGAAPENAAPAASPTSASSKSSGGSNSSKSGSKGGLPEGKDPELDSEVAKKKDPFFKEVDKRT